MVEIPLGTGSLSVSLPSCRVDRAEPGGGEAVDVESRARAALQDPHGPPLRELAEPEDSVAIVVTDVTRKTPDGTLLAALVEELDRAGVGRDRITVVVGLGWILMGSAIAAKVILQRRGGHADSVIAVVLAVIGGLLWLAVA